MTPDTELSHVALRVLLAEQAPAMANALEGLEDSRLELVTATELSEALKRLSQGDIDVVLLDLALPDSQGIVSFERMYAFAPDVPIVVLADRDEEAMGTNAVKAGAQDYLVREDASPAVLVRSLRYAVERHRLLTALRSLSLIDDLTGLFNLRAFHALGAQYLKLARRSQRGLTVVYLDFDRLKTINDSLGHHVGDRALVKVADILRASFRRSDVIGRLGGDEFAVLALEASEEDAEALEQRLREQFAAFNQNNREPYQLSVSIGMARDEARTRVPVEELLARAESNMYEEKRSKRKVVTR